MLSGARMDKMLASKDLFDPASGNWEQRLAAVVTTMLEMSRQTDPQAMVRAYLARIRDLIPGDRRISLSRQDIEPSKYRITRYSLWKEEINPWREKHRLPVLEGGLLGELIYGDKPRIIDDLQVARDDPGADYLAGQRSLIATPIYDQGAGLNMVVVTRSEPAAFSRERFPDWVWLSNLFGRATHNLVLAEELERAYAQVDHELELVAGIQRSLLPAELPQIPTMDLAVHYQTSHRAGGDYYDFFELPDGKWGTLIADVAGHGTPAAVVMAITHSIAHGYPGPPASPADMLAYLNGRLSTGYTGSNAAFVTAFYGVYDPATRGLTYASAGHHPPRVKRCAGGGIASLDAAQRLPLGVSLTEKYVEAIYPLTPGDQIVFYTDGITESQNSAGEVFGEQRLDAALGRCRDVASELINAVLSDLEAFTEGQPPSDDRTLLVAKIS